MSDIDLTSRVRTVRRFNRFYTRQIGVLHEGLLGGPLSLTEGRIVYELAQSGDSTAAKLGSDLGLDAGYLSRILRGFQERGLIDRRPSETDGRQSILSLTDAGREAFAVVDARSQAEIGTMLEKLTATQQQRLVAALDTAEALLGGDSRPQSRVPYILRPHQPGDMGATGLNGAVIEEGGMLGAGSLLPPGKVIGPNELWVGTPARLKRVMSAEERAGWDETAVHYAKLAARFRAGLRGLG